MADNPTRQHVVKKKKLNSKVLHQPIATTVSSLGFKKKQNPMAITSYC